MSKVFSKVTAGPLTANAEGDPGVTIGFPDESIVGLALSKLSQAVVTRLAVHGLSQKLGDSFAGAGSEENPVSYAKARVQAVIDQLLAGDWRVTAEGGPRVTLLARALARATGQDLDAAVQVLADKQAELDNEEKLLKQNPWKQWAKTLRGQPAIKAAIAEIELEDAQAAAKAAPDASEQTVDLGGLFAS